ncbi:hypothetical protein BJX61DRAFT_187346 [Aspergillus egyptiacus]|nr:hypothetical protein BJX61DRAFT_187346 [Aspergillus egyptiacus]
MMAEDTELRQSRRKRSRFACEPCRERKRRCNGEDPCSTCSSWGYNCYYRPPRRSKRPALDAPTQALNLSSADRPAPSRGTGSPGVGRNGFVEQLNANSAAAFMRKVGLKADPANAPKLSLFGWNVGARQLHSGPGTVTPMPIVDIVSLTDMKALANVYFAKVNPCYGFIDSTEFYGRLDARWRSPLTKDVYDSVLAGVGALGLLFSERRIKITEVYLVELARSLLDCQLLSGAPSVDLVTAWVLRVVYLRMTAPPHATWVASSTLMHLIEASEIYHEGNSQCESDLRRRIIGVAQHLNLWVSYDLGLSRVTLSNNPTGLPSSKPGDYTPELLNLLPVSARLSPEIENHEKDLEMSLIQILDGSHSEPPSVLAQCNLVLCLLRRLPMTNLVASPSVMERIFDLFTRALSGACTMVHECSPWHQIANVPFQMITVLLEMDTTRALEILPEAMRALQLVSTTYETDTMQEAYNTACLLIRLYQRRRSADSKLLSGLLNQHTWQSDPIFSSQPFPDPNEMSWLEGLIADVPTLQGADLYQLLQSDVA